MAAAWQDGNTPVHRAAMTDNLSGIRMLANCRADVNAPNKVGVSALATSVRTLQHQL